MVSLGCKSPALGDSAIFAGPMAPVPMAALAEGVFPTAGSSSVVEALVAVENSIVRECPEAFVHLSMDKT